MDYDLFTKPIAGGGKNFNLPGASALLSTLVGTPLADANVMKITFSGTPGTEIARYTEDGDTASASVGAPIYAGQKYLVTRASLAVTKIIAIGTPVDARVEQYADELPINQTLA